EEATDTRAEVVTNAPITIRRMFVTGERFIMALGTSTPMTVEWPDQDDITDWTPGPTDSANIRTLRSGSKLMGGTEYADLVNLVWTDTSLYLMQYTGSEFIYEDRVVGLNCGLAAPGAFCITKGIAFWMSNGDFHMYAGSVQSIPNVTDIRSFVFRDLDGGRTGKTWCMYNAKADAVIWCYVSNDSPDGEPDKYVKVALDTYAWDVGSIDRTTGTLFRPSDGSMLMVDASGVIWEHEVGANADGGALASRVRSGLFVLADGDINLDIMGFVPDTQRQSGDLSLIVRTRDRPNAPDFLEESTTTIAEGDAIADLRIEGRHFDYEIESNAIDGDFRLGIPGFEIQPSGARR
ncbi:MAG: hypothetical protein ACRECF_06990, partial [Methyloceanibacter sp.]